MGQRGDSSASFRRCFVALVHGFPKSSAYAGRIDCAADFEPCPTRRDLESFVSRLP